MSVKGKCGQYRQPVLAIVFVASSLAWPCSAQEAGRVATYYNDFLSIADSSPARDVSDWKSQFVQTWPDDAKLRVRSSKAGQTMLVDSCRQLFKADEAGMIEPAPNSGYSLQQYRVAAASCYAGRVIATAVPAKKSFVKDFIFNAATLRELPPDMGFFISNSEMEKLERAKKQGDQLGSFLTGAKFSFKNTPNEKVAEIKYSDDSKQTFVLTAKGDFNNDGIEDLLIYTVSSVAGGTYRAIGLYAITKLGPNAHYVIVKKYPVGGG